MPPVVRLKKGTAQRLRPANSARIFINWFWYYYLKKGTAQRLRPANSARIFINWFWYYSM